MINFNPFLGIVYYGQIPPNKFVYNTLVWTYLKRCAANNLNTNLPN